MGKGIDLAAYAGKISDTAELEILDPVSFEPTGMTLTLYSWHCDMMEKLRMRLRDENEARYGNRRGGTPQEKLRQDSLRLLAASVAGWSGLLENGKPLDCTPENARRVFEAMPFLRDQIDTFIFDRANFIRA